MPLIGTWSFLLTAFSEIGVQMLTTWTDQYEMLFKCKLLKAAPQLNDWRMIDNPGPFHIIVKSADSGFLVKAQMNVANEKRISMIKMGFDLCSFEFLSHCERSIFLGSIHFH